MKWSLVGLEVRGLEVFFHSGVMGRALRQGLLEVELVDLRHFGLGRHHIIDDAPYGGGPGMVLRPDVLASACKVVRGCRSRILCLSPQGKKLDARLARKLSEESHLILVCGRYEGMDQRFLDHVVDAEVSVGDMVVSQGEVPALLLADAVSRFIPGVVGTRASVDQDAFESDLLGVPQYTRPSVWEGKGVPEVLLSGDHACIQAWKARERQERTQRLRPDLWERWSRENLKG
jgi:tRNA (guanine37-N1)-methyltransferase